MIQLSRHADVRVESEVFTVTMTKESDGVYISGGGYSAGVSIYMLMNFVKNFAQ